VIVAHIMGIPIEENVLQLAPVAAAGPALLIVMRARLGRLGRRLRRRPQDTNAERARAHGA
jgi:hypothetical protein